MCAAYWKAPADNDCGACWEGERGEDIQKACGTASNKTQVIFVCGCVPVFRSQKYLRSSNFLSRYFRTECKFRYSFHAYLKIKWFSCARSTFISSFWPYKSDSVYETLTFFCWIAWFVGAELHSYQFLLIIVAGAKILCCDNIDFSQEKPGVSVWVYVGDKNKPGEKKAEVKMSLILVLWFKVNSKREKIGADF